MGITMLRKDDGWFARIKDPGRDEIYRKGVIQQKLCSAVLLCGIGYDGERNEQEEVANNYSSMDRGGLWISVA